MTQRRIFDLDLRTFATAPDGGINGRLHAGLILCQIPAAYRESKPRRELRRSPKFNTSGNRDKLSREARTQNEWERLKASEQISAAEDAKIRRYEAAVAADLRRRRTSAPRPLISGWADDPPPPPPPEFSVGEVEIASRNILRFIQSYPGNGVAQTGIFKAAVDHLLATGQVEMRYEVGYQGLYPASRPAPSQVKVESELLQVAESATDRELDWQIFDYVRKQGEASVNGHRRLSKATRRLLRAGVLIQAGGPFRVAERITIRGAVRSQVVPAVAGMKLIREGLFDYDLAA